MNRRLHRSRTDVRWTGVAGGVGEWLSLDPSLVRVLWVILTPLTGGLALLVYLLMWIVLPVAPGEPWTGVTAPPSVVTTTVAPGTYATSTTPAEPTASPVASGERAGAELRTGAEGPTPPFQGRTAPEGWTQQSRDPTNAAVLVGIGLIVIGGLFLLREFIPRFNWDYVWPVAIILIGGLLVLSAARRASQHPR